MRDYLLILVFALSAQFLLLNSEVCALEGFRVSVEPAVLEIPAGGEGIAAIKIRIPKGYHIYGNPVGPGTGKPTTVSVRNLPGGVDVGATRYPEAKKYFEPGDVGHVWIHEGDVSLFLPIRVKKESDTRNVAFDITLDALVCGKGTCIPIEKAIHQNIKIVPAGSGASSLSPEMRVRYRAAREPIQDDTKTEKRRNIHAEAIEIPYNFQPRYLDSAPIGNIIQAIIFGLLAGFILNFMPCVLPVVSIKIMSFIAMGGNDKKQIVLSGTFFALGIFTVFIVLASLAAFLGYGWGELFKRKEFLIVMTSLVFALALSMFDVFTITASFSSGKAIITTKNAYLESFGKGVMATFLATPCSGPFLGGTLAWTMMQPPAVIFTIFVCVGTGMALPYIVLAARPSLLKFIPKPGEWAIVLERIMGFLLIATVIYLLGIMETSDVIPMLWLLLFVLAAFWQYGKYGSMLNTFRVRIISKIAGVVLIGCGYLLAFHISWSGSIEGFEGRAQPYSFSKILQNSQAGKISLVQFTAEWCPNCRVVERTSLYTENVMKILKDYDAELLVADITRGNPDAEALMAKLGSRSIPFLAVFPAGEYFTRPMCLRDIYSEKEVLEAIRHAGISELHPEDDESGK